MKYMKQKQKGNLFIQNTTMKPLKEISIEYIHRNYRVVIITYKINYNTK